MKTIIKQSQVITIQELAKLRRPLTKSWTKAAGLLRDKRKELEKHIKQVRKEWDRRSL